MIGRTFLNTILAVAAIVEGIFLFAFSVVEIPFVILQRQILIIRTISNNSMQAIISALKRMFGYEANLDQREEKPVIQTTQILPKPLGNRAIALDNPSDFPLSFYVRWALTYISWGFFLGAISKRWRNNFFELLIPACIGMVVYEKSPPLVKNEHHKEVFTRVMVVYVSITLYAIFKYNINKFLIH